MLCDDDCNGPVLYTQPRKRSKAIFRPPCKPITAQMDTNTIYKESYPAINVIPKAVFQPSKNIIKFGQLDLNTVYNLTYQWAPPVNRMESIYPRSRLTVSTDPMELTSNYMNSYTDPGVTKRRFRCEKITKDCCKVQIPMENMTMTKYAYKPFDNKLTKTVKNKAPSVKSKWPSNFKPNYQTNYSDAYQHYSVKQTKSYRPRLQKYPISSQISSNTIYRTSYHLSSGFMKKN